MNIENVGNIDYTISIKSMSVGLLQRIDTCIGNRNRRA